MYRYIINAISQGLAFSKNEARGTFILAILVVSIVSASNFAIHKIKDGQELPYDSLALHAWVSEVNSSFHEKRVESKPIYIKSTSPLKIPDKKEEKIVEKAKILKGKELKDLNISTAEELQKIKGIGKAYSSRIIKYRNLLGGFSSMDQLREVYGLEESLVEKIKFRFNIQTDVVPLSLNSDSARVLAAHPYISYDLAWIIINYRKQNGDLNGYEDLAEIKAVNDSLLLKLRPYIK